MKFYKLLFLILLVNSLCVGQTIKFRERLLDDNKQDVELEKDSFISIQLMIGGNIYQPEKQLIQCYDSTKKRYDFGDQLKHVQPILNLGDLVIANLKTNFLGEASNPLSSPDEFALSIKYSGINTLMDADFFNAYTTKENTLRFKKLMNELDIRHCGVYPDIYSQMGNFPLIIDKKGLKIALLNYTSVINNRPESGKEVVINQIEKTQIEKDLYMSRIQNADFTIVYFDWGTNFQSSNSNVQHDLGVWCLEKGADLVVGTHPNKVMPIDLVEYYYKGKPHAGLIAYSLGNLVGSDEQPENRSGYLLDLIIKKNKYSRETKIDDYGVIPLYNYYDSFSTPGKVKLNVIPCANVEDGSICKNMPYLHKRKTINAAFEMRKMLGVSSDEVHYNLSEETVSDMAEYIDITNAPLNNKFSQTSAEKLVTKAAPVKKDVLTILPDTFYRIQFYQLKKPIPLDTNYYTHLRGYEMLEENGYYYYYLLNTTSKKEAMDLWISQMKPRYRQSFVVALVEGRRVREITAPE